MRFRGSDRRLMLGMLAGLAAAIAGMVLAGDQALPYTVIPVLGVIFVGLTLGSGAAMGAYIVATLVLVLLVLQPTRIDDLAPSDVVRLVAFLLGSPLAVLLVNRAEDDRRRASRALRASRDAEAALEAERLRLEAARREVDAALATAERERARLEEVAEAIPEPLIVYDDDGHGTYGNRAALRLFGRSFVERSLEEWGRVTQPRDARGRVLSPDDWPQVRAQREAVRGRLTLRIPMTGRDLMVDVEGTPIPGGGAVLLLRDIGKEEDERRRLSRFASFVAHELRNPLAVAKARIELAQRDPQRGERARTHDGRALESVDAAIGILERLELYSRADSGRVEASREPFELAPAVGSAIERLRARGSQREVRVAMAPGAWVLGDRQLSEQAITNLLTNADRYATPNTPIRVAVEAGPQVVLRVADDGPGIDPEVADRIFRERVTAGRGLGLGLYLVRATMEAMGGSVVLEQPRPGAVFALRWPAADPVRPTAPSEPTGPTAGIEL